MCNTINPFEGKNIYVVGGGNSFDLSLVDLLPPDRTVCINSTFIHFKKFLALFWMDDSWYRKNVYKFNKIDIKRQYYISMNKPITTTHSVLNWIKLASNDCSKYSSYKDSEEVIGNNTGCCVINFLDKMKARNIYLLGFDCRKVEGKSHSHSEYSFRLSDNTYKNVFLPCFDELSRNLKNSKVFNCYSGSAIKSFPYKNIKRVLVEESERIQ